ncbi:MFS transporter [Variovorax paradoxus]|jgi:MFS family permease|uniref:MFS transporter n=1 Tax=Variovorax paradoxus TaxID=34073 RepID=UPI0006E4C9BF|nr:MFS transporter [Variovorax paradoxus]KPV12548.1 MFS transporter [Variovorax paradoxus]KPV12688.1 MFS transporter [Variovorax paradoxus]KPV24855.1 MFS transporter [Variovorax paradoxus]KPV35974.1 MFS transporter [Variovorax paradoxus]
MQASARNASATPAHAPSPAKARHVVIASTLGTVFEWYDFYLYGALAAIIGKNFFASATPLEAYIFGLLAFGTGFVVRPFGALVFGRLGDMIGRKYTFLATILIMGLATFAVGLLPTYSSIGSFAPAILIGLRMLQGLAIGGEYGGAAVYIAEHAPPGQRGGYTSWLQTAFIVGLCLALGVILGCRLAMSPEAFETWGWRVPFLLSMVLLAISVWIRMKLHESPVFAEMKSAGALSRAPIRESFGNWRNLKLVLIVLFGLQAGQAVVTNAGPIYSSLFLVNTLRVDPVTATTLSTIGLLLGAPFYVIFGYLSDRIGRKPIVLASLVLGAVSLFPVYHGLTHFANPALEAAQARSPVVVAADPARCSFQFNPVGTSKFTSSCDVAKSALVRRGIPYSNEAAAPGTTAVVRIGTLSLPAYDGAAADAKERAAAFDQALGKALEDAGYRASADPAQINHLMIVLIIVYLQLLTGMAFGPMAAMLVEMFPARIRYTSMSLPYHIGNGWIGGLLPATVVAIQAATGSIFDGLWYPLLIAGAGFVLCWLFVPETRDRPLDS